MVETYLATEQAPEKQNIRRLGQQAHSDNRAPAVRFEFGEGAKFSSELQKSEAMRQALEEAYEDITGKNAREIDDADLSSHISAHYRATWDDPNTVVVLKFVSIDPKNKSESFAAALDKVETFTERSKKMLVADAFSHLESLDAKKPGEMDKLCDAIVAMQERGNFTFGHLEVEQQQKLRDLIDSRPDIVEAFLRADERYATQSISRGTKPGKAVATGSNQLNQTASTQPSLPSQPAKPVGRGDGGSQSAEARRATAARAAIAGRGEERSMGR